ADRSVNHRGKALAAVLLIAFMLPNPGAGFWSSAIDTPAFFTSGEWRSKLGHDDIVLTLPFERTGNSMLWQATTAMGFRMAAGYTSVIPPDMERLPIVGFFGGSRDLPEAADQLKAFIAHSQVSAIIEDQHDPNYQTWGAPLAELGITPLHVDGIDLYRVPPDSFREWGEIDGETLESRATALRFDTLLEACGSYSASGRPLAQLSSDALHDAGLLPHDWKVSSYWYQRPDFAVVPIDGRISVALGGTYSALRPLAERMNPLHVEISYPYPKRWDPARNYPPNVLAGPMLFSFDRAQLAAAVKGLRDSPPPERVQPFLPSATTARR
ncbi:MAG TPA: hypothetical protein VEJ86_03505, partial [Candidatus Binataceae bacterium]|nr:hypothetical protein [Candidatus Binataceae bacterium]